VHLEVHGVGLIVHFVQRDKVEVPLLPAGSVSRQESAPLALVGEREDLLGPTGIARQCCLADLFLPPVQDVVGGERLAVEQKKCLLISRSAVELPERPTAPARRDRPYATRGIPGDGRSDTPGGPVEHP
jgi:hypothetical protein